MKTGVDVSEATHVVVAGRVEKIASKWGIDKDGCVAPPSQGGFGVITESGRRVTMWQANSYIREDGNDKKKS